jgi:hypothetical protein
MSSNRKFAKKEIDITKDRVTHDPQSVTKKSSIRIGRTDDNVTMKIGVRIKKTQTVAPGDFEIKPAGSPTAITLTEITDRTDWRYVDVETVLPPGTDDKWILYTAPWFSSYGKSFVTTIRLKPYTLHDNGFQVVTVIANPSVIPLATGHYIFGLSIIPGATNENEPYSLGGNGAAATSTKGKKTKKKAAKKKTAKKKKK